MTSLTSDSCKCQRITFCCMPIYKRKSHKKNCPVKEQDNLRALQATLDSIRHQNSSPDVRTNAPSTSVEACSCIDAKILTVGDKDLVGLHTLSKVSIVSRSADDILAASRPIPDESSTPTEDTLRAFTEASLAPSVQMRKNADGTWTILPIPSE